MLDVARACECVSAISRLAGDSPAPAASVTLKIEFEPAPFLAALSALTALVTDKAPAPVSSKLSDCLKCFVTGDKCVLCTSQLAREESKVTCMDGEEQVRLHGVARMTFYDRTCLAGRALGACVDMLARAEWLASPS